MGGVQGVQPPLLCSLCCDLSFPVTQTLRGTGLRSSQSSVRGDPVRVSRAHCSQPGPSACRHLGTAAAGLPGAACSAEGLSRSGHGAISSPCSLLLWPLCCLQDLGVPRVWLPTLCSLSRAAGMLPAPLAPPCAQGVVPSPCFCYNPSLRKTVALGLTLSPLSRVIAQARVWALCWCEVPRAG